MKVAISLEERKAMVAAYLAAVEAPEPEPVREPKPARVKAAKIAKGRPRKPSLTAQELELAFDVICRDGKSNGLRSAARAISRSRGADNMATEPARKWRSVSPRWLFRELDKCGKNPSAAKVRLYQFAKNLRPTPESRDTRDPVSHLEGQTSGESARVWQQDEPATAGIQEVAADRGAA